MRELHHRVRLNAGFQFDLQWWGCFLPIWNRSCLIASIVRGVSRTVFTSDASGSWGCGAFTSDGQWFQLQLPVCWDGDVAVWDSGWKGLTVTCLSDNAAVIAIVNSGRSKMDRAMH